MTRFSPFIRPLEELRTSDLAVLRNTSEGWYVEYKQEVPNASSIAKSVSAFANHYGGWIFYGIKECKTGQRTAEGFPGVAMAELSDLQKRITDAVASSISPTPHFESLPLLGPNPELGLPDGRCVVALRIAEGFNPPYVHSSGRIYRRVADRSDPYEETDRGVLDLLWEKGRKQRARLTKFLKRRPSLSSDERNAPYMKLFIIADPLNDRAQPSRLKFAEFADVMGSTTQKWTIAIPFENAFASTSGFVARHVFNNDPQRLVFTLEHSLFGTTVVTAPMQEIRIGAQPHYAHFEEFLKRSGPPNARTLDLSLLFLMIGFYIGKHWELTRAGGVGGPFYAKARFFNIWRCRPYLDLPAYIEFVQRHGVPVIQDTDAFAPPGSTFESLTPLPDEGAIPRGAEDPLPDLQAAAALVKDLWAALGLPIDPLNPTVGEMIEVASRASKIHSGPPRLLPK